MLFGRTTIPAPATARPRFFEVRVRHVIRETASATTLVFDVPQEAPPYRAGQYLSIDPRQFPSLRTELARLEALKGRKELPRQYSMASAPGEPLAITIKEEPYLPGVSLHPPLLSPLLVHGISVGTCMQVLGFTGPYNLPADIEDRTDHLVHVVAGSGVVPNFSLLKFALAVHPRLRHTFIYSNKTWDEVIFRDGLTRLEASYPDRLKVVHTLTRQSDLSGTANGTRHGRVTRELLFELVPDAKTAFAYVCGPAITPWERRRALESGTPATPRFLESTLFALKELGLTHPRLKHESYG